MKIQIKQNTKKQWWFRIVARNGKVLCSSETYHNKKDCLRTVERMIKNFEEQKWVIEDSISTSL